MNLNKAFIIGNLTRDPESRTLPSGQPVASFGLATNRIYNKEGQRQQQTEFHNVVLFGRLAEIAQQYLKKGSLAFIEGRIQTRSWQAPDGQKKWKTEIIGERMQLGPRGSGGAAGGSGNWQQSPSQNSAPKEPPREELDTIEYGEENMNPADIPF